MENSEKKFAQGFFFNRHPNSPDFVVGSLGVKVEEAIEWVKQQKQKENGFINIDIKKSQDGKYYIELMNTRRGDKEVCTHITLKNQPHKEVRGVTVASF